MIVNIAAWYYIVNGALAILPVMLSPFRFTGSRLDLGAVVFAGLFIGIGVGLLKRHEMGRWAAPGQSPRLDAGHDPAGRAAGLPGRRGAPSHVSEDAERRRPVFALMIIVVLSLLLWVVGILISFKLFRHLCSQEGCAQSASRYGSSQAVLASCGAWVGLAILNLMFTGAGGMMWQLAQSSPSDSAQAERRERDVERMNEARHRAAQDRAAASRAQLPPLKKNSGSRWGGRGGHHGFR